VVERGSVQLLLLLLLQWRLCCVCVCIAGLPACHFGLLYCAHTTNTVPPSGHTTSCWFALMYLETQAAKIVVGSTSVACTRSGESGNMPSELIGLFFCGAARAMLESRADVVSPVDCKKLCGSLAALCRVEISRVVRLLMCPVSRFCSC